MHAALISPQLRPDTGEGGSFPETLFTSGLKPGPIVFESSHHDNHTNHRAGDRYHHQQRPPSPGTTPGTSLSATVIVVPADRFLWSMCGGRSSTETEQGGDVGGGDGPGEGGGADAGLSWSCGVRNTAEAVPAGFVSSTMLFAGTGGLTDTTARWGAAMQALHAATVISS